MVVADFLFPRAGEENVANGPERRAAGAVSMAK